MNDAKKLQTKIESTLTNSLHVLMSERCKEGRALNSRDFVELYEMLKSCAANLAQILTSGGEQ